MAARPEPASVRGFSLVELLIATTLGLILISGLVTVFSGNRRSSELNTAMADLQESARFALDAIARDIRMSGYQGCLDVNGGAVGLRAASPPTSDLRSTSTSGSVVTSATDWTPDPLPGFDEPTANPAIVGTHTLQVQFGDPDNTSLAAQMTIGGSPSASAPLALERSIGLVVGDLAIVANCDVGDLFAVTAVDDDGKSIEHKAPANVSGNLTRPYGDDRTIGQTTVSRFASNIYYVGDTGRTDREGEPVRALYLQSLPYGDVDNPPMELVEGVENMRVAFGLRLSDGATRYVRADDLLFDPSRVESVKVGLLMASYELLSTSDDTTTYRLADQPIVASDDATIVDRHPRDRRLRLAFSTTVKIRNRRDDS